MPSHGRARLTAKNSSCIRLIRVRPASTRTASMPRARPSSSSRSAAAPIAAWSRMAIFKAPPPSAMKPDRYSRSVTLSHSASGSGVVVSTSTGRLQDKPDGVVVVMVAALVEQGQPLAALASGRAAEFEPVSLTRRGLGLWVEPQQVRHELLLRVVRGGGRQQRELIV